MEGKAARDRTVIGFLHPSGGTGSVSVRVDCRSAEAAGAAWHHSTAPDRDRGSWPGPGRPSRRPFCAGMRRQPGTSAAADQVARMQARSAPLARDGGRAAGGLKDRPGRRARPDLLGRAYTRHEVVQVIVFEETLSNTARHGQWPFRCGDGLGLGHGAGDRQVDPDLVRIPRENAVEAIGDDASIGWRRTGTAIGEVRHVASSNPGSEVPAGAAAVACAAFPRGPVLSTCMMRSARSATTRGAPRPRACGPGSETISRLSIPPLVHSMV